MSNWNHVAIHFELDALFAGGYEEIRRYLDTLTLSHPSSRWSADGLRYEVMNDPRFPEAVEWRRLISGGKITARHRSLEGREKDTVHTSTR